MMFEYSAELVRIVDGDTLDADIDLGFDVHVKKRIRLYGINTPESRTRDLEEKKRGKAATLYVEGWFIAHCGRGVEFTLLSKELGKFGRVLGIVKVEEGVITDSRTLNEDLITDGHAVEYFGGKR
jgi:micrococcal nuclease